MEGELGGKMGGEGEEGGLKPTRSFRYEDYNTRRVFLRSYPLQWDWDDDDKQDQEQAAARNKKEDDDDRSSSSMMMMKRQVVLAVVEWGEGKLLLLRRLKRKVALYLLACHYRPPLPLNSSNSCSTMLTAR